MQNNWRDIRDLRTDACSGVNRAYKNTSVKVVITSDVTTYKTQVIATTLLNILSRWCHRINVVCEEATVVVGQHKSETLTDVFRKVLFANEPDGQFTINEQSSNLEDIVLYIGSPPAIALNPYISIDACGWIARCSYLQSNDDFLSTTHDSNPIGPAFAACLGNAELFRWANKMFAQPYSKWYSLYDMSISDRPLANKNSFNYSYSFGRMHIVGCGAIGSSFIHLLSLTNWVGDVLLVDMDKAVELHNTSSSLIFTKQHVESRFTKVAICQDHLKGTTISAESFSDDYGKFPYQHEVKEKSADLILCFANDNSIWSTIQHIYPPLVFHATTSKAWGINVGRHIPLKDSCILCTFKDLIKTKHVPVCGKGEMPAHHNSGPDKQENDHTAILPFLSPAAAILTFAKMVKTFETEEVDNSLEFNMNTPGGIFMEESFAPFGCYVCNGQTREIYEALNANTRYWTLSL